MFIVTHTGSLYCTQRTGQKGLRWLTWLSLSLYRCLALSFSFSILSASFHTHSFSLSLTVLYSLCLSLLSLSLFPCPPSSLPLIGDPTDTDYTAVGCAITTISSNLTEMSKGVKLLAALIEDDTGGSNDLMGAARNLAGAVSDLLKAVEPASGEVRQGWRMPQLWSRRALSVYRLFPQLSAKQAHLKQKPADWPTAAFRGQSSIPTML